jgi:hypothetical protein
VLRFPTSGHSIPISRRNCGFGLKSKLRRFDVTAIPPPGIDPYLPYQHSIHLLISASVLMFYLRNNANVLEIVELAGYRPSSACQKGLVDAFAVGSWSSDCVTICEGE